MNPARYQSNDGAGSGLGTGMTAESTADMISIVDELLLLAEVIEAGGFRQAGSRTRLTRSLLSRRIAALEKRLGVSLLMRNTRNFGVTEVGVRLYEQAQLIRAATRSAMTIAEDSLGSPAGLLRVACPIALSQGFVGAVAISFARAHPLVRLCLSTTSGTPDSLNERHHYDLVIYPSTRPLPDSDYVARHLVSSPYMLAASPNLVGTLEEKPGVQCLDGLSAIGWNTSEATTIWHLIDPDANDIEVQLPVRFAANNLLTMRDATIAGLGVARLPRSICQQDIQDGRLRALLPEWTLAPMEIYVIYPSRRRLSLAGQTFITALQDAIDGL